MNTYWFLLLFSFVTAINNDDPAGNQIVTFRNNTLGPIGILTTSFGAPVDYKDYIGTLNKRLIFHEFFMETLTHFNRERIPPRVVHAKGGGAFGYFELTHDIKHICKAKLFSEVGKKTPIAVRFSVVPQEIGGIDTSREGRGFSIKFYTEDGNLDITGLNTPLFVIKDPLFFQAFIKSAKRNPQTSLFDANMFWNFLVLRPESINFYMRVFSDAGIPDGYRHMPGHGIHTFQVANEEGESFFVRFHFIPDAGIKNLGSAESRRIAGYEPDYANRDLFNAISKGNYPSWTVNLQVLSTSDVKHADFDVFDITRILPEDKYPMRPIGRLILDRNPANFFAEIEHLTFCPGNLVPGILGAPDKLYEARRLAYRDAQYYRLGTNFHNIEVNRPVNDPLFYIRDGKPPVGINGGNSPNYFPNSFNGPIPFLEKNRVDLINIFEHPANNFDQSRDFYERMKLDERARLVENILGSLGSVTDRILMDDSVKLLSTIHLELGKRVWEGLFLNETKYY